MAVFGLRFCARAFSSCGKWGPLSITVHRPLTVAASLVVEHRLQTRRLSNCGSRAQLLRSMWDLSRQGLEPVSPASAGRFSTTAPTGKPRKYFFKKSPPENSVLFSAHSSLLTCCYNLTVYSQTIFRCWANHLLFELTCKESP